MRDRLRTKNSKYKTLKLRNANQYWKFCFEEQQPVQIDDFNLDQQEQIQNPLPTMTKMITLTQVKSFLSSEFKKDNIQTSL